MLSNVTRLSDSVSDRLTRHILNSVAAAYDAALALADDGFQVRGIHTDGLPRVEIEPHPRAAEYFGAVARLTHINANPSARPWSARFRGALVTWEDR